jgi:hypothetical protein
VLRAGLGTLGVNVRSREGNSQTGHRMLTTSPIKSESLNLARVSMDFPDIFH